MGFMVGLQFLPTNAPGRALFHVHGMGKVLLGLSGVSQALPSGAGPP